MKIKRPKFSIVEWLRSFRLRRFDDDHAVAVRVYDNGRLVFSGERVSPDADWLSVITAANSITSQALGDLRRAIKLETRKARRS